MDDTAPGPHRIRREALAVAALLALAYLLLRTSTALAAGSFSDDGVYLALGKALAEGEGFRSVYAVGGPVHLKYPPFLPALYAGLWTAFGTLGAVHLAATLTSLVAAAAAAGFLWWVGRAELGLHPLPLALFAVGPFLLEGSVQYLNLPISEPWFIFGWAACLVLFPWAVAGRWERAVVVGLVAGLTALVRTQAVVLIPTLVVAMWVRRRSWRASGLLAVVGLIPVVGWALLHGMLEAGGPVGSQPDESAYVAWAPDSFGGAVALLVEIVRSQVARYWTALPPHLAQWPWLGAVLWGALVLAWAHASVRRLKAAPELVLSVLGLGGVVFLWPYSQDRFVLAILPFAGLLVAAAGQGVWRAGEVGRAPLVRAAAAGVLCLAVLTVGLRQAQIRAMASADGDGEAFYFHPAQFLPDNSEFVIAASRWLMTDSGPEDRLLTPLSSALWLYTGRQGVNATPAEPNVGASVFDVPGRFLATRVLEDDVNLLLLWNPNFLISRDGATLQTACPDALEFLHMTDEPARVAIFRIHRSDPCFEREFLDPARVALKAPRTGSETAQ